VVNLQVSGLRGGDLEETGPLSPPDHGTVLRWSEAELRSHAWLVARTRVFAILWTGWVVFLYIISCIVKHKFICFIA